MTDDKEGMNMTQCKTIQPSSQFHVVTVDGARYEVTSNYKGEITYLDLLKKMLKRDIERQEVNGTRNGIA